MPVMDILDENDHLTAVSCVQIFSLMVYPGENEHDEREQLCAQISFQCAQEAEARGEKMPPTLPSFARLLADAQPMEQLSTTVQEAFKYGLIAGKLLLLVLACAEQRPEWASLSRAIHEITATTNKSRPVIMNSIWKPFQPVAHLWAAAFIQSVEDRNNRPNPFIRLDTVSGLPGFLARSEYLRIKAENHLPPSGSKGTKPSRKTQPLIPPGSAWASPPALILPNFTVAFPPLTNEQLERFKSYKAKR